MGVAVPAIVKFSDSAARDVAEGVFLHCHIHCSDIHLALVDIALYVAATSIGIAQKDYLS